ncbi:glutaredoxin domain-containing protein [Pseudoruegeria sp. HB172150]|uniref:glutaredoxin domain-containing protein n=1 Tax=Pseudoruegeria sp. HB172150 TaxID=2721164 RepID=UPI00210FBF5F|nr:glutaredoxin domain-containing protein [Pseudoruegeria sp. HB172150]
MFALEWCEFCWAVRNCMGAMGVPLRVVALDTPWMHETGMGGDIRKDLNARTGGPTIPQVFIGGENIGGAMDILAMQDRGELVDRLAAVGLAVEGDATVSGTGFLPKWVARRSAA